MAATIFAVALVSNGQLFAQSCSGIGSPTLQTIPMNGDPSAWDPVLSNPLQLTVDGESVSVCSAQNPVDRDCDTTNHHNIGGRDLARFAWTYDNTYIYVYLKRYGSASNQNSFFFYMDLNRNQVMDTNIDKVFTVTHSGSTRNVDSALYTYCTTSTCTNGTSMAMTSGGFADGYTITGWLQTKTVVDAGQTWGFADGTGFLARIPWASLPLGGVPIPVGTAIYFHVGSENGSTPNTSGDIGGIDDNLGGPNGRVGSFGFLQETFVASQSQNVASVPFLFVDYIHTLTNTGTLDDRYFFTATSTLGWQVQLYDRTVGPAPGTLMGTDLTGDGTWDTWDVAYDFSGTHASSPSINGGGTFQVTVRLTPPSGSNNVQDVTKVTSTAFGNSCLKPFVQDTTAIGDVLLLSTPQVASVVAGNSVTYPLTLTNFTLADIFDFSAASSAGSKIDLCANATCTTIIATSNLGDGTWNSINTPTYDTNIPPNGKPDLGTTANSTSVNLWVRVTSLVAAAIGTVDTTTISVQGAAYGKSASAILTTTVRDCLTFSPSYTTAASTNKFSGPGTSVYYAHTLINSTGSSMTVTLSAGTGSSNGYTVKIWNDPDGDGNPADGGLVPIATSPGTGTVSLAANGGTLPIVVEEIIPSGVGVGTIDTTTVTATGTGCSAKTVTDQVRVSRIVTYSDSGRTVSASGFARCDFIYALANNLSANTTTTYQLDYCVGGNCNTPPYQRSLNLPTNGNGEGFDNYAIPFNATVGTWTIRLRSGGSINVNNGTLVDSITITIDASIPTVTPVVLNRASYPVGASNISVTATFNNTGSAALFGTSFKYVIVNPAGNEYLQSSGLFTSGGGYTGAQYTDTNSPRDVLAGASSTDTSTVNPATFPSAGIYTARVSWVGSCSNALGSTTTVSFPVGTTLRSTDIGGTTKSSFDQSDTVYLAGSFFLANPTAYKVVFYDPSGNLVSGATLSLTATGSPGSLSGSIAVSSLTTPGTWTAVAYLGTLTPPSVYNSVDTNISAQVSFCVTPAAPTITSITDESACAQNGIRVNFTPGTPAGNSFDLYKDNVSVVTGYTSGALYNPGDTSSHSYKVAAVTGSCLRFSAASAFTDVNDTPGAPTITGITDDDACAQTGIHVAYSAGSPAGTSYDLYKDGSSVVTGYTSAALYNPGDTSSHNYTVVAVNGVCTTSSAASAFTDPTPVVCTALDQCHDAGVCNPGTGVCSNPAKTDGTSCNDGNACTTADTCQAGACTPGTPVVCTASDQCHDAGVCNPGTGVCTDPPKANGTSCDDGNACTTGDTCAAGACVPGTTPLSCNDGNGCTDDSCNAATGCVYTDNTSACDDGISCTQTDTCSGGACSGSPYSCDDGNPCTDDSCNGDGTCGHTNNTAACDDGIACTTGDTCSGGICAGTISVTLLRGTPLPLNMEQQNFISGAPFPNDHLDLGAAPPLVFYNLECTPANNSLRAVKSVDVNGPKIVITY